MNIDYLMTTWKKNREKLDLDDKIAKEKGRLIDRYIEEPYADGYAVYKIIKKNKKTVRIQAVVGVGDSYVIPAWGEEANVPIDYILNKLAKRDDSRVPKMGLKTLY